MPTLQLSVIPQRILIILLGAIGDVTRALPLLTRVRRAYPDCHITWAVEPAAAPLLDYHPALDEVLIYHRSRGLAAFWPFLIAIRKSRFDLVLDLQRHAKSGLISWWSQAPTRLGFHRSNTKEGNWLCNTHTIPPVADFSLKLGQYLKFADALGLPHSPNDPNDGVQFDLRLRPEEETQVEALLAHTPRPFVTFFLGSRWPSRFWFPQATARVAQTLMQHYGMGVVLIGSPSEVPFAQAVSAALETSSAISSDIDSAIQSQRPITNLTGQTRLRDLIGIFSRCRLAFGPDSGPMHIAAATGTPVISLWGATSPIRSAPWGSEHLTLCGPAACSPCYTRRCRIGRVCMQRITPEQVLSTMEQVFSAETQSVSTSSPLVRAWNS